MKKIWIALIVVLLMISSLACASQTSDDGQMLPECKEQGIDDGRLPNEQHIWQAWEGDFSVDHLKSVINDYQLNGQPILLANREDALVSFEVDFEISSYSVARISPVSDLNIDVELNGYIDLAIETKRDGNQITLDTTWWYSDGDWVRSHPVWSYLLCVRDEEMAEHYYYFRVDYNPYNLE